VTKKGDEKDPAPGQIRVGIGGWTYEPWQKTFYPEDMPQARALEYASRQVTAIEVNGTFYRTQTPAVFAKWRDSTPEGFVFSLKAPRYTTQKKMLREAGAGIERFLESGVAELGDKLGPILWSFAPTKRYEPEDFEAFLKLLPGEVRGLRLRHALDVRHESFANRDFIALARRYSAAAVFSDTADYPSFADVTADFVYARLKRTVPSVRTGYAKQALEEWARRARTWAQGSDPADLHRIDKPNAISRPRDVFVFFIAGAKERAPAAAQALLALL
jgi:uncharacterized protein YecE (DUF72 family)